MAAVRAWLIYLVLVFGGGALVAPLLYWVVQWSAGEWAALKGLAGHPFHRYVNRAMLGLALGGLWPLLRGLGLRSWPGLGWGRATTPQWLVGAGFTLGLLSVALTAAAVLLGGRRVVRVDLGVMEMFDHLARAGITAIVVAGLEETLFRGVLQGGMRRPLGAPGAIFVGAMAYATLHFLARVRWEEPVTWHSGFGVLVRMLAGFEDWRAVFPSLLNLLLAGLALGLAFERTGTLHFPVGLHAGCVLGTKFFAAVTREIPEQAPWLYGTGRLVDGWAAFPPLLLSLLVLPVLLRRTSAPPAP